MKEIAKTVLIIIAVLFSLSASGAEKTKDGGVLLEIFFLPHAPAVKVVKKVEEQLKSYANIRLKKYPFGDHATKKKTEQYHLKGHFPVVIFINGKDQYTVDGNLVTFRNFPKGDAFVPMFEGKWTYKNLETVIMQQSR